MSCSPMTLRMIGNAPVWQLSIGLAHLIVGGVCTIQPTILQAQHTYELLRIPADPAKGFLWPYYLSVPSTLVRPAIILVEPNNSGTTSDDQSFHDRRARSTITSRASDPGVRRLGSPILVPTFPRPESHPLIYTHALDRDALQTRLPALERIDLQLIAMIEDAKRILAERTIEVDPKVFMWGYSAAGTFTNRFTILHPELVKAASLGGCSCPTIPLRRWKGKRLPYPVGVADLKQLVGKRFDARAFRSVPIQIFRGDADTNDEVAYDDGYTPSDRRLISELLGGPPPFLRYPRIEMLYRRVRSICRFVIEPGVGHNDARTREETWPFFDRQRTLLSSR